VRGRSEAGLLRRGGRRGSAARAYTSWTRRRRSEERSTLDHRGGGPQMLDALIIAMRCKFYFSFAESLALFGVFAFWRRRRCALHRTWCVFCLLSVSHNCKKSTEAPAAVHSWSRSLPPPVGCPRSTPSCETGVRFLLIFPKYLTVVFADDIRIVRSSTAFVGINSIPLGRVLSPPSGCVHLFLLLGLPSSERCTGRPRSESRRGPGQTM